MQSIIWWGMPPTNGNGQKIESFMMVNPDKYFTADDIERNLGIKKNTVSGVFSILNRTGWIVRHPDSPEYKHADKNPSPDRNRVIAEYPSGNGNHRPRKPQVEGMVTGQEYIIKCIAMDVSGNPVIQDSDSGIIYHGLVKL